MLLEELMFFCIEQYRGEEKCKHIQYGLNSLTSVGILPEKEPQNWW